MVRRTILLLGLALILITGTIIYLEQKKPERPASGNAEITSLVSSIHTEEKAKRYTQAKELVGPAGYLNTDPITIKELIRKKVTLVDFWTYSCINCQRTIPYLNAWYEKYRDKGLVIIGVHTPEFEFEKERANVEAAIKKFGIQYPVVQDNDYATWTAYGNRYWPRKYLIDIDGFIVYDHIGEGGYEETERRIQELLQERMARLGMENGLTRDIARPAGIASPDPTKPLRPEIYFGSARNEHLGEGDGAHPAPNTLYLSGKWNIQEEYAKNISAPAKIIFRYQARNVYFVASAQEPIKITVLKDGVRVKEVTVREAQLYPLIEDTEYGEHTLEILLEKPGLRAFTFTFG